MPHLMRLLSSLAKNSLSRPKPTVKNIRLSEKCFDIDYKYSACRQMKKGQSHQDMMVEYYTRNGVGGK